MNLINILHPLNAVNISQPMEMYLAPEVIKNMTANMKSIISQRTSYKILDNGCYELDHSISMSDVFDCAEQIRASEIILPDSMGNFYETLRLTTDALEFAYKQGIRGYQYMGVVQGETWDDYMACAELFLSIREITCIGIPKKFARKTSGSDREAALARSLFAKEVAQKARKRDKEVHMLGLSWNVMELTSVADVVRSCDTNNIVENIKAGNRPFTSWSETPKYSLDVPLTIEQERALKEVNAHLHKYLKCEEFFL